MRDAWVTLSVDVTTTQSHKRKGTGPMKKVRFLGLDVHAETIAVAVAEPDGEVRSLGIIPIEKNPFANWRRSWVHPNNYTPVTKPDRQDTFSTGS